MTSPDTIVMFGEGSEGTKLIKPEGITLAWQNLSYKLDTNTREPLEIITDATGIIYPGEVVAVMGPSGAGKSSFLDLLAGRKEPRCVKGKVLLNGSEGKIKHVSTYVMQDDALLGILTVRENIMYSARLCLPSHLTYCERLTRVNKIINEFGLDRVADTNIGTPFVRGVSGGERRRVSIASQIVNTPRILFLDEPTSGLDSTSALNVIRVIVEMAHQRKLTVVLTIHQPNTDTYSLFDKVLLLSRGKTIYFGKRDAAPDYFARAGHEVPHYANPADFFMTLLNTDFDSDDSEDEKTSLAMRRVEDLASRFSSSPEARSIKEDLSRIASKTTKADRGSLNEVQGATFARSFAAQVAILVSRGMVNATRNVLVFWIRVLMYGAMAVLMGTTWYQMGTDQNRIQDRFSAHFFSVAFLAFMSVTAIPSFLEERLVFQRERANGYYRVGAYVLANTIVSIPSVFMVSLSFVSVAYYWIGFNPDFNRFLTYLLYLYLALFVAESMVVFVASLLPLFVAALTVASFLNGFFMAVQGYFVQKNSIPHAWLWGHHIDYQKYAFEALIYNDFDTLTFQCDPIVSNSTSISNSTSGLSPKCFCIIPNPDGADGCSFSGQAVLDHYGYSDIQMGTWAMALLIMVAVFRLGMYIVLRKRKPQN